MKKISKNLFASIFALALAVSAGTALAKTKINNTPEIVFASEEETHVDDESSITSDESVSSEDSENSNNEEAESANNIASDLGAALSEIDTKEVFKLILEGFKDAIRDLFRHFKMWFKL